MKKLDEEFQDVLLIEAIEYINAVRPLLENIQECFELCPDGFLELKEENDLESCCQEFVGESNDYENFAKKFHKDQYNRFKEKYGKKTLDEYMKFKERIYSL